MKERNFGIDMLKIFLAFMVIIIHINANGTGQVLSHSTIQPWKSIVTLITYLCYPAVNTYILITGYYSYKTKKEIKGIVKSLSLLWLSAVFFSLFGYAISIVLGNTFHLIDLIKRFFPITRGVWWFYTVYFALMLLSPFINRMLYSINIGEHKMLLFILLLLLSIFPTFVNWEGKLGSNYGYSLIWFIVLYITGAYLHRTNFLDIKSIKKFFAAILVYLGATISLYIVPKVLSILGISVTFAMYNSIFVYIQAIALFIAFSNMKFSNRMNKIVGSISGLALASYLLHCQEDIEKILWASLAPAAYADSAKIIYISILICFSLFIISALLELVRRRAFKFLKIDKRFVHATSKCYGGIEQVLKIEVNKDV